MVKVEPGAMNQYLYYTRYSSATCGLVKYTLSLRSAPQWITLSVNMHYLCKNSRVSRWRSPKEKHFNYTFVFPQYHITTHVKVDYHGAVAKLREINHTIYFNYILKINKDFKKHWIKSKLELLHPYLE